MIDAVEEYSMYQHYMQDRHKTFPHTVYTFIEALFSCDFTSQNPEGI
jgi:hypothetical protein